MKEALPVQIDESILEVRNNVFLSLLDATAKQLGVNYEPTQLTSFAITRDDIDKLSSNHAKELTADVSNKNARTIQFGLEKSSDALLAQLYWKKYSLFMSELIARLAKAGPLMEGSDHAETFYLNLGFSRHLIGLFTEQIRKPEIKILVEDIDEIKKSYFSSPFWCNGLKEYQQFGLLRGNGRQIGYVDLFEQSMDHEYELREHVSENDPPWDPKVFQQLNAKLEQQKEIVKNYPYSIKVNNVVFHSNKPIESIHPDVFPKFTTAIEPLLHCNEVCSDVIFDSQKMGDCYVEAIIRNTKSGKVAEHHKYYFSNQFLSTSEGKGFYLGYIYEFNIIGNRIDCYHCAMHSNMKTVLATHYNAVVKSLHEPTDKFLPVLGEFCFLFINVMPYARGSAAIGEWLMRGLAKAHGIELGAFSEKLSWDFNAFLTTSSEKYAEEYRSHFQQITPYLMTSKNELMLKMLCDDITEHVRQEPAISKELLALHAQLSTLSSVDDVLKVMRYVYEKSNERAQNTRSKRFFDDIKNNSPFYSRAYNLLDHIAHDLAPIVPPKKEKIVPKYGCC
jgi:hypothetical protein